jgi:hypothetical protein
MRLAALISIDERLCTTLCERRVCEEAEEVLPCVAPYVAPNEEKLSTSVSAIEVIRILWVGFI